jgi:hypothetical protein
MIASLRKRTGLGLALIASTGLAQAGQIIAATSGLNSPQFVVDFGANLYSNFTPITTQFPPLTCSHTAYFTTGVSNNLIGGFLTNDFSGLPNTLKLKFAQPVTDVSFVYHQIGTSQPSVFRVLLGGVPVDSFSNLSNQFQPNNYFGFTNLLFDEVQLDFVGDFNIDTVAYNLASGCTGAVTYCTPLISSNGCSPAMNSSGVPSLTNPGAFTAGASNLEVGQNGLMFFGTTGQNNTPFFGGTLCVNTPLHRLQVANSGGGPACSGSLSYMLSDFLAHPVGGPLIVSGQMVNCQVWTRDPPAATTVSLSNGLEFTACP